MNYASARHATNTQTQPNANECEIGTNCAITSPQNQGDGTANSPANTQISNFNEEQDEGVESPVGQPLDIVVQNCGPGLFTTCRTTIGSFGVFLCASDQIGPPFKCTFRPFSGDVSRFSCDNLPEPRPGTQTLSCIRI
jgi:hypothetical protein